MQEGIYFEAGVTPPGFFALLLLSATGERNAERVAVDVGCLWDCYRDLKEGIIDDLRGAPPAPGGELEVLLGLGAAAFTLADRLPGAVTLPDAMQAAFTDPGTTRGGPICESSGITYDRAVKDNPGAVEIALQFTAKTPLAVERAVVETWKVLEKNAPAALEIKAVYTGTQRDDGRSWIDFHDGLSNLPSAEREELMTIPPPSPPALATPDKDAWTFGGTYLAFIRLDIDLNRWRRLKVSQQEALVGRQKLSGLPLLSLDKTFRVPGDTSDPPHEADWKQLRERVRPDDTISFSHVQLANHHNPKAGGSSNPMNRRIYRQGYPFLEPIPGAPGFRVGLNFISFQSTPDAVIGMLGQEGWLGATNFGGKGKQVVLLRARAAGVFLVPPRGLSERFPGYYALTGRQT